MAETKKEATGKCFVVLVPDLCGGLNMQTQFGKYSFASSIINTLDEKEARELVKVREKQHNQGGRVGCDLLLLDDAQVKLINDTPLAGRTLQFFVEKFNYKSVHWAQSAA